MAILSLLPDIQRKSNSLSCLQDLHCLPKLISCALDKSIQKPSEIAT